MFLMYHYENVEIDFVRVSDLGSYLSLTIEANADQITLFMTPDQIEYLVNQIEFQLQDLSQKEDWRD